jgi:hypothetical protein
MGKLITAAMLCAVSMIGSALIASQGFAPEPIAIEEDASLSAECAAIDDDHARRDCLDLNARPVSRQ